MKDCSLKPRGNIREVDWWRVFVPRINHQSSGWICTLTQEDTDPVKSGVVECSRSRDKQTGKQWKQCKQASRQTVREIMLQAFGRPRTEPPLVRKLHVSPSPMNYKHIDGPYSVTACCKADAAAAACGLYVICTKYQIVPTSCI